MAERLWDPQPARPAVPANPGHTWDQLRQIFDSPSLVSELMDEVERLHNIIATLHDHADDCDQGGDCRCGRNQKLREVSGAD